MSEIESLRKERDSLRELYVEQKNELERVRELAVEYMLERSVWEYLVTRAETHMVQSFAIMTAHNGDRTAVVLLTRDKEPEQFREYMWRCHMVSTVFFHGVSEELYNQILERWETCNEEERL